MPLRQQIWQKLANEYKPADLVSLAREITLEEVPAQLDVMLKGGSLGKSLVKI